MVLQLICNYYKKRPLHFVWDSGSFVPAVNFCHNDSQLARSKLGTQSSVKHCYFFLHLQKWSLGISAMKWHYQLSGWLQKEWRKEPGSWNPAQGKCKVRNREYISWIKYDIPIGQIPGKYRSNSRGKKLLKTTPDLHRSDWFYLTPTTVCVWQFIWHHHPPAAWRAVKTNRAVYNRSCAARMARRKICICSLFSLSLRAQSQGVGSSRGEAVSHTLWSWRCQHRVLSHREENQNVLIIYHMFYFYIKANHCYFYIPAFPTVSGPWNPP